MPQETLITLAAIMSGVKETWIDSAITSVLSDQLPDFTPEKNNRIKALILSSHGNAGISSSK